MNAIMQSLTGKIYALTSFFSQSDCVSGEENLVCRWRRSLPDASDNEKQQHYECYLITKAKKTKVKFKVKVVPLITFLRV